LVTQVWTHVSTFITGFNLTTSINGVKMHFLGSTFFFTEVKQIEPQVFFKMWTHIIAHLVKFDMHLTCTLTDLIRIHFNYRLSIPKHLYKEVLIKQVSLSYNMIQIDKYNLKMHCRWSQLNLYKNKKITNYSSQHSRQTVDSRELSRKANCCTVDIMTYASEDSFQGWEFTIKINIRKPKWSPQSVSTSGLNKIIHLSI